jgi:DNA invertase Pin-like site-specific DNA recombinase
VSLEAQESAMRAYCRMRGLEIVEMVRDGGVSAGKPLADREGGKRVLKLVHNHKVKGVIAWKLDRLFRDCSDCLLVTRRWDKQGVSLHLIDLGGQAVDTSSAMGRFFLTVIAGVAELERNQMATVHGGRCEASRHVRFGSHEDPEQHNGIG